jgi:peptidoglycan/LPS O-acetylase OafA/YrhL
VYLIHGRLIAAGRYIIGVSFQHFDIHFPHSGGIVVFAGALFGIALTFVIARVSWRILEQPMLLRGHAYKY